jgi:flagellin-specific chaperone FliS
VASTNLAANAAAAYRASQQLDARPAAVLAGVHEELHRVVSSVISTYRARVLDEMCRHAERASQILLLLDLAMQSPAGGPGGVELRRFYAGMRRNVSRIQMEQTAQASLQEDLGMLRMLSIEFRRNCG